MPNRALIVVDVLNDFMPGYEGPMQARGDAPTLLDGLNTLLKSDFFSVRLAIGDHHPPGHVSFASSHPGKAAGDSVMADGVEQQLFPEHCIQGSEGAQYPEGLQLDRFHRTFHKGTDVSLDCFSAFYDTAHNATGVGQYLKERSVEEVYIAGLVTETCIKATTLDALKEGSYAAVALIADVCRGMQSPQDESADFKEMEARGARIVSVQDCT